MKKLSLHNKTQGNRNDLLQNQKFNKREKSRFVKLRKKLQKIQYGN